MRPRSRRGPLVLCVITMLAVRPASGAAQALSVGVRGGLGLAGMLWADPYADDQAQPRVSATLGLTLAAEVSRWTRLEVGMLWARKGFADEGAHIGAIRSDYLELPVTIVFGPPASPRPHLTVGSAFAVRLRCRVDGVARSGSGRCDDPLIGMGLRPFDVGAVAGLGVAFRVGAARLSVDLLAELGVTDVKREPLPPGGARNLAIHLSTSLTRPVRARRQASAGRH